ncbi:MAG: glycosyltransferase family 2 protein [Ignavibacteria bacterium]
MNKTTVKKNLLEQLPPAPEGKTGWPWTEETDPLIYEGIKSFPKISIITPSYNQGEFIEQTIRSVLLQNYPDIEYIIIDGGSTDGTRSIIEKYSRWIKYSVSEKDKGQSHGINKGLVKCEGEIFNWLNSDDYYYKDCFKSLAENYIKDETYIIAGNYRFFYEKTDNRKERIIDFKLRDSLEETIACVLINQPSTFFRLDIFKSLGKLDEKLHFVMDQDIWKKFLFTYGQDKIRILKEDLTNFRFHSTSKTYQYKFNNEYVNIFYSIAVKAGMKKQLEFFKKAYGNEIGKGYEFKYEFNEQQIKLAKKVINNFIFFVARNSFTAKNIDLLNLSLSSLDVKYLNDTQKNYSFKLKVKSKLIKYKLDPVLKLLTSSNNKRGDLEKAIIKS